MSADIHLTLSGIKKLFGNYQALCDISLSIKKGEFVCLLGPSGCGKTTLLRCIAGLEKQSSGTLFLADKDISQLPPQSRDYGILFQSYALFPNLTVTQNIAYGLSGLSQAAKQQRVRQMLDLVGLNLFEKKYPAQLSGGQQQRVALARALAPSPSLLLLDEPMSALDAKVREYLCHELRQLQRQLNITTVMVTHHQDEAMLLADRIAVMNQGYIEQYSDARTLYLQPASEFVADFIGQGNWITVKRDHNGLLKIADQPVLMNTPVSGNSGRLFIRPESIKIHLRPQGIANEFTAEVQNITFLGNRCIVQFELTQRPGQLLRAELSDSATQQIKHRQIWVCLPDSGLHWFCDPPTEQDIAPEKLAANRMPTSVQLAPDKACDLQKRSIKKRHFEQQGYAQ